MAESESPPMIFIIQSSFHKGAKLTGGDRVLLKEDTGSGGDVEAGAVRDNEEDEVGTLQCEKFCFQRLVNSIF